MNITPEERTIGRDNYYEAVGSTRRDFLRGVVGAGVVTGAGLGGLYFGYGGQDPSKGLEDPLRVGIIGTGDEGGILIGSLNPNYVQVVAIADIRPSSIFRAINGDWRSGGTLRARPGLRKIYDWTEAQAHQNVQIYDKHYRELLEDPNVEAVIIALPLFLHHAVAIEAMKHGKHVLTEKLMAHNIGQCKEMARVADKTNKLLATGHQRHYSVLYDNAVNLIKWNVLGEIHHIRAQWHRGNLPGADGWKPPLPGGEVNFQNEQVNEIVDTINNLQQAKRRLQEAASKERPIDPKELENVEMQLRFYTSWDADQHVNAKDHHYVDRTLDKGRVRTALEELCRWRLWDRTGGGLMAELGSHQLDAASIFVSALRNDGQHVHPLAVHAMGGRHTFPYDRDAEDHVYCMFEFPGPGYEPPPKGRENYYGYYDDVLGYPLQGIPPYSDDKNKKIVVTYSSINGNGFGGYGEVVMGTKGSLVLEREQDVMLFKDGSTSTRVKVKQDGGNATMDSYETGGPGPASSLAKAAEGPISRGYREEIEHWAWCIRNPDPQNKPKCHPEVAMGDAIIALTAKLAIANSQNPDKRAGSLITFKDEWFDIESNETPDGSNPRTADAALRSPMGDA